MRRVSILLLLCLLTAFASPARAALIADSVAEFSNTQGQDNWNYGFFDTVANSTTYDPNGFSNFTVFNSGANRWETTMDQVGNNSSNSQFLSIGDVGGHPTGIGLGQDRIIWAIRRYVSEVDSRLRIDFDLRKVNVSEPRGGGITGRIFVDGVEVFTRRIDNLDDTQNLRHIIVNASVGTNIDFVIDPTGVQPTAGSDGPFSARADGSRFSSTISTTNVPEPSSMLIFSLLGASFLLASRRRKRGTS